MPTDKDTWYRLKVTAQGGHFTCYDDDKMIFDFDDNKIAKGKIGLWARDDSQARIRQRENHDPRRRRERTNPRARRIRVADRSH